MYVDHLQRIDFKCLIKGFGLTDRLWKAHRTEWERNGYEFRREIYELGKVNGKEPKRM